ncbi:Phospholipid-transporting ATPase ABCA3 [Halotydeus destructor]|nr:Phospholipid-transporting ATPase ABCA3 [Halotydeus destructor]
MLPLQQFRALLWKCYIVRKRHFITLAFETILPLVLSALLVYSFREFMPKNRAAFNGTPSAIVSPARVDDRPVFRFPQQLSVFNPNSEILYAPLNGFTEALKTQALKIIEAHDELWKDRIAIFGFEDEETMLTYYWNVTKHDRGRELGCLIVFHDNVTDAKALNKLSYTLRPPPRSTPDPSALFPSAEQSPRWHGSVNYYESGSHFVAYQALINEAFMNLKAQSLNKSISVSSWAAWRFPYPTKAEKSGITLTSLIPPLVVFGFIVTFPILVKRIAEEKVNKSREMFRMMGLSDFVYWSSTFAGFFILYFIQGSILTFLYTFKWQGVRALITGASPSIVFVVFMLYGIGFITFGMFLSIPFTKPVLAVVVAVILATVTYVVPYALMNPLDPTVDEIGTDLPRYLCSLFPNYSFTLAITLIGKREIYGLTATWSTLFDSQSSLCSGTMSLGLVMVMMVLQIIVFIVLIWYLDKVWPWQDGVPKPWYFPVQVDYWKAVLSFDVKTSLLTEGENLDQVMHSRYFERQTSTAENIISVRGLRKKFGNKMAVDGIDLDIKHGEITCLLGHNGAGKTTTMSMITGLFPATSGTILVNGYDVAKQVSKARESISLCPQHNVLYDELTVSEHLKLYAAIKGLPWSECGPAAVRQASAIQLGESLARTPSQLSGGMKRKLCLGIALIGGSQVVILDEPTSGLDPDARRMIWDVLREVRRERTILLTTHYMEEADALADSIAIMTAGKISCRGTPMYLKNIFSTGYMLRIAKGVGYDGNRLQNLVRSHFPRGSKKSEIDTEVIFALESEDGHTDSSKLPGFFKELETLKPNLGVASFGLSLTTLEDVFLKVGHMEAEHDDNHIEELTELINNGETTMNTYDSASCLEELNIEPNESLPNRVTGLALFIQRLKGLLLKRVNFGKRYWPMFVLQMVIPAIIFGLAIWVSNKVLGREDTVPDLTISSVHELYGTTKGFREKSPSLIPFERVGQLQGIEFEQVEQGANMTAYLLNVSDTVGLNDYIRKHLFGLTLDRSSADKSYELWFQYEAYHALPAAVNLLYESLLNELTGKTIEIAVTNRPMLPPVNDLNIKAFPQDLMVVLSIFSALSVPFLAASYVLFPIHERASQAKLLQLMTGLPVWLFWLASLLFDMLAHAMASALILIVLAVFDNHDTFTYNSETIFSLLIVLMLNGLAAIPIAYCFSCVVKKPGTGFALLVVLYVITGMVFSAVKPALAFAVSVRAISEFTYDMAQYLMKMSPMFSLTTGVAKVYHYGLLSSLCAKVSQEKLNQSCPGGGVITPCCPEQYCKIIRNGKVVKDDCIGSLWSWSDQGIAQEVTMLAVGFALFTSLLFIGEYGFSWLFKTCFQRPSATAPIPNGQDEDVSNEAMRVKLMTTTNNYSEDALIVNNLRRHFGNFVAVNGLSFGVHKKEIFGLLGVNGAGKTTTFKMLTGDILPTAGDARSGPLSIVDQRSDFQQQLGYCPQFDALLDKMTGIEMLFLFGRLRGIPEYLLQRQVEQLIRMSDLTKHAHKPTETYSGGNKRKLSLAIALIGSPKLLLLDEPTSGVDPGARRKIWSTLSYIREHYGCSIILTSHSMEECEALCSRLAIMVSGQFRCLGPVQHLRKKYGEGYTVILKLKRGRLDSSVEVQQAMESSVRGAVKRDEHETVINYHVTDTTVTWTELFENLREIEETV